MFTYTIQLNDEDYIDFQMYHAFGISENRKAYFMGQAVNAAGWLLIAALLIMTAKEFEVIVLTVGMCLGWIAEAFFFYRPRLRRHLMKSVRRMHKAARFPYGPEGVISFEENGLVEKNAVMEKRMAYAGIEKVYTGESAFYLFQTVQLALILPFRAFKSEEEKRAFDQFIKEKTSGAAETKEIPA